MWAKPRINPVPAKKPQSKSKESKSTTPTALAIAKEAASEIKSHERECAIRYENIEKRLDEGSDKFKKIEMMLWGVYPFIVATIVAAKFL
jgi:hypothetical protein